MNAVPRSTFSAKSAVLGFDAHAFRSAFPLLERGHGAMGRRLHYLDNAATTQVPQRVLDALVAHETTCRANVRRGFYPLAEAATEAYEGARATVAAYLGAADPREVVFTSSATAAINLVALAMGERLGRGDEVVLSVLEQHGNLIPWLMLRERTGITLRFLTATGDGRIDARSIADAITPRCRLVAVTHGSNVTGAMTDPAPLVAAARAVGAWLLLDGAQRAAHGPLDVASMGADFYVLSSHKVFGPTGVGVLWGRRAVLEELPPVFGGGGMSRSVTLTGAIPAEAPYKLEAGTPPIAQAVGLATALDIVKRLPWADVHAHLLRLTGRLLARLGSIRGCRVLGPLDLHDRLPIVSFAIDGIHPHDLCHLLGERGVCVRGGHHCAEPLMESFGLEGTTRVSLAPYNDDADVDALLDGIADAERLLGRR